MNPFNETVLAFNALIQQNEFMEALDRYYDEGVVSTDNLHPPHVGKAALVAEVNHFLENATIKKVELVSIIIEDNLTVSNWYYVFDHQMFGKIDTHQLSVQRWKSGKIIQENHFYNQ